VRSSRFGITEEGLPEARSPDLEVTSFHNLVASLRARSANDKTDLWALPKEFEKHHLALQTVCDTTDIGEIDAAIEDCRLLLALTLPSREVIYHPARALGKVLFHAFKYTGNIEYLNESIAAFRNILGMPNLKMPNLKFVHFKIMVSLKNALGARFNRSGNKKDFDEVMQLLFHGFPRYICECTGPSQNIIRMGGKCTAQQAPHHLNNV
jgi:hypothetical protein